MLSLFPGYCRDVLGTAEGTVTLFLALFSIGIGAGSLLCGRLSRGKVDLGLVPLGLLGMTLFTFDLFRIGQPQFALRASTFGSPASPPLLGVMEFLSHLQGFLIATDLLLLSVFSGLFIVPLYALMQERSESSHVSRVIAANNILNALFMVGVSGLLMGLLGAGFAIPRIFGILGGLNVFAGLVLFRSLPEFMSRLRSRFQPN